MEQTFPQIEPFNLCFADFFSPKSGVKTAMKDKGEIVRRLFGFRDCSWFGVGWIFRFHRLDNPIRFCLLEIVFPANGRSIRHSQIRQSINATATSDIYTPSQHVDLLI